MKKTSHFISKLLLPSCFVLILMFSKFNSVFATIGQPCCPKGTGINWMYDSQKNVCFYTIGTQRTEQVISCGAEERCQAGPPDAKGTCVSTGASAPTPPGITCGNIGQPCCPNPTSVIAKRTCVQGISNQPFQPNCLCLAPTIFPNEERINFGTIGGAIPGLKLMFQPGLPSNVSLIISELMKYLFVIAGLLLLFYLIAGGFQMMTAASDEKGLVGAKGKITNALVGFLLLFVSYWIVQIIEYILGIKIF